MKASFARLDNGWGVRVDHDHPQNPDVREGTTIAITKRDGSAKQVTVGRRLEQRDGGRVRIYALASKPSQNGGPERVVKVTEPGVYETADGAIFIGDSENHRVRQVVTP